MAITGSSKQIIQCCWAQSGRSGSISTLPPEHSARRPWSDGSAARLDRPPSLGPPMISRSIALGGSWLPCTGPPPPTGCHSRKHLGSPEVCTEQRGLQRKSFYTNSKNVHSRPNVSGTLAFSGEVFQSPPPAHLLPLLQGSHRSITAILGCLTRPRQQAGQTAQSRVSLPRSFQNKHIPLKRKTAPTVTFIPSTYF